MPVRAKVVCSYKKTDTYPAFGDQPEKTGTQVQFGPVYNGSEENKQFFASSPGLNLQLFCVNEAASEQFDLGQEYYLDFSRAE